MVRVCLCVLWKRRQRKEGTEPAFPPWTIFKALYKGLCYHGKLDDQLWGQREGLLWQRDRVRGILTTSIGTKTHLLSHSEDVTRYVKIQHFYNFAEWVRSVFSTQQGEQQCPARADLFCVGTWVAHTNFFCLFQHKKKRRKRKHFKILLCFYH